MSILQPSDIVEIGIEKEIKRRDFYGLAAGHFADQEDLAELFGKLRDWEEGHIVKFRKIRDEVKGGNYAESYPGEIHEYMAAVVDSDLYEDLDAESFALKIKTAEEALTAGIGFEKDAILFFGGLANFVDPKSAEVIQQLIEEEQQHMIQLFEMKSRL